MPLYPDIEPFDRGMLYVGDGNHIYWDVAGNPRGKPVVVLHGGPGSGSSPSWRRFFNPKAYRIVLFDQRGCGNSTPHASDHSTDLVANTTPHLIGDLERLRAALRIERWLIFAGSWGTTLALAYGEGHRKRVSEMVLFSIATTSRREVEWITRHAGRFFPEAWQRFCEGAPATERGGDLADAYARLLHDPDPTIREKAAKDWCAWEDSHLAIRPDHRPDPRYDDPRFRMAFARLVTHYWRHAAWLEDGLLLNEAGKLAGVPGVLIHGRLDVSSPPDIAWSLARAWPGSELLLVQDASYGQKLVTA
jgi:proline iminopeptidase